MTAPEITWDTGGARELTDEALAQAVDAALALGDRRGASLSLVFVSDEVLANMHAEHLGDPGRTDVITFDLGDEGEGPVGELFVSVDRARVVAERRGVSLERELTLYVVHGVLHLCGFDDRSDPDRASMRAAEVRVMSTLGFVADESSHEFGAE